MDKGIELYKEFIDNFVTMSENCVDAIRVKKRECSWLSSSGNWYK